MRALRKRPIRRFLLLFGLVAILAALAFWFLGDEVQTTEPELQAFLRAQNIIVLSESIKYAGRDIVAEASGDVTTILSRISEGVVITHNESEFHGTVFSMPLKVDEMELIRTFLAVRQGKLVTTIDRQGVSDKYRWKWAI